MALPPPAETQEHKLDESDASRQGSSLCGQYGSGEQDPGDFPGRQRQAWRASSPPLRSLPSTNCLAVFTRQLLPLRLLGDTGHLTGH